MWVLQAPGKWESQLGVKVHNLCRVYFKPDVSVVLTVMSGLDPHMIRNGSHMFINGVSRNLLGIAMSVDDEVATSVLISDMATPYDNGDGNLWNVFIKLRIKSTFGPSTIVFV